MSAAGRRRPEYSQHFLRSGALASQIVDLIHLTPSDLVIEVGPGTGILTDRLAERAGAVRAIEIDPLLVEGLRERYADAPSVTIIEGDFLDQGIPAGARVVANLPYSITSATVRALAASEATDAHLVVQHEAALKFSGSPRGPETAASLLLKPWWHVEILGLLKRTDFAPPPSVDSAMLWLARRPLPLVHPAEDARYRRFVHDVFGSARTMRQALRGSFTRPQVVRLGRELRLDLDAPPSTASFDQWLALFRSQGMLGPRR